MAHSARWLSLIRLRVPCPHCRTSRIQTSGSRVWVRASRTTPPSPTGTKRPCAPVTETNVKLHPPSKFNDALILQSYTWADSNVLASLPVAHIVFTQCILGKRKTGEHDGAVVILSFHIYSWGHHMGLMFGLLMQHLLRVFYYENNMQNNKAAKMVSKNSQQHDISQHCNAAIFIFYCCSVNKL